MRHPLPAPLIKVCCIASVDETLLAIAGAGALWLVSTMLSAPGVIDDDMATRIAATVPLPTRAFLLTARGTANAVAKQQWRIGAATLQLVATTSCVVCAARTLASRSCRYHVIAATSLYEALPEPTYRRPVGLQSSSSHWGS